MVLSRINNLPDTDGKNGTSSDRARDRQTNVQRILEELEDLHGDAKKNNFEMLAYLIDMAILEVKELSRLT